MRYSLVKLDTSKHGNVIKVSRHAERVEACANFLVMAKYMYVYILLCADESYYTGVTNDLDRRIAEHNEGISGTAYTFKRRPVKLAYHEVFTDPTIAINFEKKIKGWSRAKKLALIEGRYNDLPELAHTAKYYSKQG